MADLLGALAKAEREGTLREKIHLYWRPSLLIVDEIGYLPVIHVGGNLFFQLVNARFEKCSMICTSNRGFSEWGETFSSPVVATALLYRFMHHAIAIQIEGSSYHLRRHAELLPEYVGSNANLSTPKPEALKTAWAASPAGRRHASANLKTRYRKSGDFYFVTTGEF